MAWLQKKVIVRWLDAGDRRVPPKTPGSRRVRVKSKNWYMCWRDGTRKRMIPLFSDKKASEAEMRKRVAEGERRQAGLDTGLHADMQRPIGEQLAAYLASLRTQDYSDFYVKESERILNLIIQGEVGVAVESRQGLRDKADEMKLSNTKLIRLVRKAVAKHNAEEYGDDPTAMIHSYLKKEAIFKAGGRGTSLKNLRRNDQ